MTRLSLLLSLLVAFVGCIAFDDAVNAYCEQSKACAEGAKALDGGDEDDGGTEGQDAGESDDGELGYSDGGDGGTPDAGDSCSNGAHDGLETDVDCGGSCPAKCNLTEKCAVPADCASGFCHAIRLECTASACDDGVKNNQETDIDCGGGGSCAKCGLYQSCGNAADCVTGACIGNVCVPYPLSWGGYADTLCVRSSPMAAVVGDRFFVSGVTSGCDPSVMDSSALVEWYDHEVSNVWEEHPTLQIYAREGGVLRSGPPNNLYVLGGFYDHLGGTLASVSGAPGGGSFKSLSSMNQSRAFPATTTLDDGRLFVAGGHQGDSGSESDALSSTEYFTPDTTLATGGSWTLGHPLGTYRVGAGAAQARDGRIFVMGGSLRLNNGGDPLTTVEVFPADGGTPSALPPMPVERAFFGMVRGPDDRFYLIGGKTSSGTTARVDVYEPTSARWTRMPDLPSPRASSVALVGPDNRIYAIGGTNASGSALSSIIAYGPSLSLSPESGPADSVTKLLGSDFPATTEVRVYWSTLSSLPVDEGLTTQFGTLPTGTSQLEVRIPAGATPGFYDIYVVDSKSLYPARARFEVTP